MADDTKDSIEKFVNISINLPVDFSDVYSKAATKAVRSFNIPIFKGDKDCAAVPGTSCSIYRTGTDINDDKFFDSIVPLEKFIYRGNTCWRFLDILSFSNDRKEKLIQFSRKDNPLIRIEKIESDFRRYLLIRMEKFIGFPLVPEYSSIDTSEFIEDDKNKSDNFSKIMNDARIIQFIYDAFVDIQNQLIDEIGCYLSDIAPNNVIYYVHDDDSLEFRFIDVVDIKYLRHSESIDMSRLFFITRERLPKIFLENLPDDLLVMFPTLAQKRDKRKRAIWENRVNLFFNSIKRDRYIELSL